MEQSKYLIDSNAVIDYLGNTLPKAGMEFMNAVVDARPNLSVITQIEVVGFSCAEQHYTVLSNFIDDSAVIGLTENVVNICIEIRKNYRIKLPDALVAASALTFNLILITRNTADFKNFENIKVIDPHSL